MSRKSSLKIAGVSSAAVVLTAIVASVTAQTAVAASLDHGKHGRPSVHGLHHLYAGYRGPQFAPPTALPYAPEYGFLHHVPPNAIRMPGYTFVPGVGILGESCDMPTSACSNEYRDVQ